MSGATHVELEFINADRVVDTLLAIPKVRGMYVSVDSLIKYLDASSDIAKSDSVASTLQKLSDTILRAAVEAMANG